MRAAWLFGALLATPACDRDAGTVLEPPIRPDLQGMAEGELDALLVATLSRHGFTGHAEGELMRRRGRPLDPSLVEAGRLLFFDPITALSGDNSCSGCHTASAGFGGTQSIAIGVDNKRYRGPRPCRAAQLPTVAHRG